jgi:hypothetical protein
MAAMIFIVSTLTVQTHSSRAITVFMYLNKINYLFTRKATIAVFLDRCLFPVPDSLTYLWLSFLDTD